MSYDSKVAVEEQWQRTYENDASARRVTLVDSKGNNLFGSTNLEGGGKVSVGTSAVEVTFTGTTESIIITADYDNSGILYVGKSNVATDGSNALCPLYPGESLTLDYNDVSNAIYVVASEASQYFWKGSLL